ncbi:PREDICTED: lung adenoma susceptibility protein 2 [Apaloderma vittatum]|uniref:lung adenoma susceptibility protein 2 n=1 Tax=Apaloderma vittatum TaxID=57397 RepID=UPI000521C9F0|nr:PREDICTED: lung adenoma susceptibility protein 2 [Apaloderma vittatum]
MKNMASSREESGARSPDSTVSSLLTSYSTDSKNSSPDSLIHYKDKLYSSASEALDAYIKDFDLSLTSSEVSTGKIRIFRSAPKRRKLSKRAPKPHVSALDDFNLHVGPGSRASPSSRQSECDVDLISLATDDLLAFPADGSLPSVWHSPLKARHQRCEGKGQSFKTLPCPGQTSPLRSDSAFALRESGKDRNPRKDFRKNERDVCGYDSVSSKGSLRPSSFEENSNTFPVQNYPRWLTSQKSDLSVSGISSIPNFPYPAWLKSYNLLSGSAKETDGRNFATRGAAPSSRAFEILEERCSAEDQLELLPAKADGSPESSSEDLSNNLENAGSPSTTDILGAERPWENAPGTCRPLVPVCREDAENALPVAKADIVHKFLEDCLNDKNKEGALSGGQRHRPLEALKRTLFELQAIQGSLSQAESAELKGEVEKLSEKAEAELQLCDSETTPLTNSIRKALQHLSRLKISREDPGGHQEQSDDGQDKQERENNP